MKQAPASTKLYGGVAVLALAGAVTAFLSPWEGRELQPYRDLVGIWTVCEGVTGPAVKPGRRYTDAECNALTTDAVAKHLRGVAVCIHQPLAEHEWVAVGSWTYNVGVQAACKSTMVRQINEGAPSWVWCKQLLSWDKARKNGQLVAIRGLTLRRQAEYQTCIGEK